MNELKIEISNMPQDVTERYVVFRVASGSAWYWGAYDNLNRAIEVAREVDGAIAEQEETA